jgi:hypothetical protein
VSQRCWEAYCRLNPEKCQLFQNEMQYLGHTATLTGRSDHWPREAEGCTGVATTMRQTWALELTWTVHLLPDVHSWIQRHHQAIDPPHEEEQTSQWSPETEAAFWSLKKSSYMAPILGYSLPGKKSLLTWMWMMWGLEACCPNSRTARSMH